MHVLTKIFIVMVSLLAVFLVPLVVVYSHNEDSYKARVQTAQAEAAAAKAAQSAGATLLTSREAELQAEIGRLSAERNQLIADRDQQAASIRKLETDLAQAGSLQAEINNKLAILASSVDSGQQLVSSLINELRTLRSDALAAERQRSELEQIVRDIRAQLDVAVAARKAMEEELQRVKDERAQALDTIGRYRVRFGDLSGSTLAAGEIAPDRDMSANVINVRRSSDMVLVEIDAGSADGVKQGWVMVLARGGKLVGKLHIVEVDVNRSTGRVSLETKDNLVQLGDEAVAYAGSR